MIGAAERSLALADEAAERFDAEQVVVHLSAAIRQLTETGDVRRAAMTCARLGDTYVNALGNMVAARAWFARAQRLVTDEPPCIEQGWVAVAAMGCEVDDPAVLLAAAELALDRARRFGDVNLETKALADAGLANVQSGRIVDGMALLDEAMALACGPADDPGTAAKSVCSFFTACYHAADFGRADAWAEPLRQHGLIGLAPVGPVFVSNHCDSVHATLLIELGRWGEAEALLQRARADFEAAMGMASWHPDIALADLRIRQGRCADAEQLLLGKDHSVQALLPAARLHLARGDHRLAGATARRGLRAVGADQLRAVELLTTLVDAELAAGDLDAAAVACDELGDRTRALDVPTLRARAAAAQARLLSATDHGDAAIELLEATVDDLDPGRLPWLRGALLVDLARLRELAGDRDGAIRDADAAFAALASLDVVLAPDDLALQERLSAQPAVAIKTAVLSACGSWWEVSCDGTRVRLADTKGLRYLAELIASPGVERHVLDLVDRVEGLPQAGLDRRALGDTGPVLDAQARTAYRRRIEQLRAEADDALAAGRLETAERHQDELDQLVRQLAQAFGLGGRARRAGSAAERARLNVTRALRTAIAKVGDALPGEASALLDRRVRTGAYCCYPPEPGDSARWIVQRGVNGSNAR
ncbi:MAG: hypothetical protein ACR2HQ_02070 [Ilumatobacteraceae bacterium]